MELTQIRYETRDAVALVTLNRPERLNAWTPTMGLELGSALDRADADPAIGAVVVTGAGRGFCAGADVQDRFEGRPKGGDTDPGEAAFAELDWVSRLREAKPVVWAVNGAAVGIGMTMILPGDVIVASEKASFGMLFVRFGLVPELASTRLLAERLGPGRARELCLTGRLCYAAEAAAIGLADHLVPHEELIDRALGVAGNMAANPAPQLRMIKRLLAANALEPNLRVVQEREAELLASCYETPEHAEAVAAFLEKRAPRFR